MSEQLSFIEKQFPVSKLSKESYKERRAGSAQTMTSFGKWWGRKPTILVRAAILGCILPSTTNPQKDMEIFQKLLMLDNEGLLYRKRKNISIKELYAITKKSKKLSRYIDEWFTSNDSKIIMYDSVDKKLVEEKIFSSMGYDEKLKYCVRPEEMDNLPGKAWNEINLHCGTNAKSIEEFVMQLSQKRYGHLVSVGDCFSGGGSIPFEAARIGCSSYGSDLNPIAGLLTIGAIKFSMLNSEELKEIKKFQKDLFDSVKKRIDELNIEKGSDGSQDFAYLYCSEVKCPECQTIVPLSPNWVIGKGTKTIAELELDNGKYNIHIRSGVTKADLEKASHGTITAKGLKCPCCGKTTAISVLRHDTIDDNGNKRYGLRNWEQNEYEPREDDSFTERLFCIKAEKEDGTRYYREPERVDLEKEDKINEIVKENFDRWQKQGIIPSTSIEAGFNTSQLERERGWKYWHQLFNPRQILTFAFLVEEILKKCDTEIKCIAGILNLNRCLNFNSKLCRWRNEGSAEHNTDTFYNQALNTVFNYGARPIYDLKNTCITMPQEGRYIKKGNRDIRVCDARDIENIVCDYWITDPPYADAVNYHELSEFFLAWDKKILNKVFPEWYTDSKRVLAVRGDEDFANTMIEIYSNLANHMPDNGMQIVMFTHSDPAVWAQLAIIMWKSGLKVTAAWNIATETEAVGLKSGNYVKGTVLLVLRKQTGDDIAFLDEINADIRNEVKNQIESMQKLDDKEEPNFSDPDYVLAAYAASLKVITSYASIEDLDLDYELNQAITNPARSKIVTIIENAKKIAYDCVIPLDFDNYLWRELTNAEKFYIKGLESEKRGNYQIGTYQEFARGFSIGGYSQLMASERANTARLKTPVEMAGRTLNDVPDFEHSVMRMVFEGIYVGVKEDNNPNKALGFIKSEMSNYWDKREMIQQILRFLTDIKNISNMQEHWGESSEMAELLLTLVAHDSV